MRKLGKILGNDKRFQKFMPLEKKEKKFKEY